MKKILFVCSGNTCRSPLAEGIAKKIFPLRTECSVEIKSAGSSALEGMTASGHAIEVARRHDVDISGHGSRLLNRTDVREADLIVAMTQKHRETVGILDPAALAYTVLLTDFCDENGDVPDPIGGGIDEYQRVFNLIDRCIEELAARVDDYDGWKRTGDN